MRFFALIVMSFILGFSCSTKAMKINRITVDTPNLNPNPAKVAAAEQVVATNGCNVNVCFALDGSGAMSKSAFDAQKQFIALIAAIVAGNPGPPPSAFAATQYGLTNTNIRTLTTNAGGFVLDVLAEPFLNAPATFMSAGIGFCVNQLDGPELADDVNKIVVIGDGSANLVVVPPLDPASIVSGFATGFPNRKVCGVAIRPSAVQPLADVLGVPSNMVVTVPQFADLLDIIDSLVEQICT